MNKLLRGALWAGGSAMILNGAWWLIYHGLTGLDGGKYLSLPIVILISLCAGLAASLIYALMAVYSPNYRIRFIVWGIGVLLLSLLAPLSSNMPDGTLAPEGFALLAIPMHIITGLCCLLFVLRHTRDGEIFSVAS